MEIKHWRKFVNGWVIVIVLVAIGSVVAGVKWYRKKHAPDDASKIATATRGDLDVHFSDSGELRPMDSIDIAPKTSGRVTQLFVAEGGRVRKSDKLAIIQPGRSEAERYLPYTVISPISGTVMRYQSESQSQQESRIVQPGDYVKGLLESNPPDYLMTIADLSKLIVRMRISEMDILKLHEGMAVNVTIDALPGETFPGKVNLISPQAERDQNNIKNFRVYVLLDKIDPRLKPGMTARVDGLLQSRKNALKIPLSAVFEEENKQVAYLQTVVGKPKRLVLKLGIRNDLEAEVLGGVSPGQNLLTEKPGEAPKL